MGYEIKTKLNDSSVKDFLDNIYDINKRQDCYVLLDLMSKISGEEAKMWGKDIVGFGVYKYGGKVCEGEWMKTAFSPKKAGLSIYIMDGFDKYSDIMENLGKYKNGRSCLNIKKLEDINIDLLKKLVTKSYEYMTNEYKPCQK